MDFSVGQFSIKFLIFTLCTISCSFGDAVENEVVSARVESCSGCQLNRLPEVKKFIFEDVPLIEGVVFKHIQGAPPELVLLNKKDEEIDRIALGKLSRDECNRLLTENGFSRKSPDPKLSIQHNDF